MKNWFLSHKITLFHTIAHFSGWLEHGQEKFRQSIQKFFNEVNDLASTAKAKNRK
jgi:hypothetical protein